MTEVVTVRFEGDVALLTMDDKKENRITDQLCSSFAAALDQVERYRSPN